MKSSEQGLKLLLIYDTINSELFLLTFDSEWVSKGSILMRYMDNQSVLLTWCK